MRWRARATRAAWSRALASEMSGSSPEPDAVTASTGTGVPWGQTVELAVGDDPFGHGVGVADVGAVGVLLVDGVALGVGLRLPFWSVAGTGTQYGSAGVR